MNKKALQSNANHPLADSLGYLMNKFEHVSAGGGVLTYMLINKFYIIQICDMT